MVAHLVQTALARFALRAGADSAA
eukprot:SAG31_NODE_40249_length_282_cov_0.562842_1_plen_23_part_01